MTTTINADNGVSSGSAGLKSSADSSGVLALQTNGTTAISIDTSQAVTMAGRTTNPTTISVGAATPSTSGAGITFPATQSASSNANTLDDYEEGTWTGTLNRNVTSSSLTYTFQGTYTKIGRLVTVDGFFNISAIAAQGSGANIVQGLPFVPAATYNATGSLFYNSGFATTVVFSLTTESASGFFFFKENTNSGGAVASNWAVGYIIFSITYPV